jgi:hypothetical protein
MAARPGKWRVLAVFSGPSLDSAITKNSDNLGCVAELIGNSLPFVEVNHKGLYITHHFLGFAMERDLGFAECQNINCYPDELMVHFISIYNMLHMMHPSFTFEAVRCWGRSTGTSRIETVTRSYDSLCIFFYSYKNNVLSAVSLLILSSPCCKQCPLEDWKFHVLQGKVLESDSLKAICEEIRTWQPSFVYICAGYCDGKRGESRPGLSHLNFPTLNGKGGFFISPFSFRFVDVTREAEEVNLSSIHKGGNSETCICARMTGYMTYVWNCSTVFLLQCIERLMLGIVKYMSVFDMASWLRGRIY